MADHLLLGYPRQSSDRPEVLYLGPDGGALEAARKSDHKNAFHRIIKNLDGVGYRKNNSRKADGPAKKTTSKS